MATASPMLPSLPHFQDISSDLLTSKSQIYPPWILPKHKTLRNQPSPTFKSTSVQCNIKRHQRSKPPSFKSSHISQLCEQYLPTCRRTLPRIAPCTTPVVAITISISYRLGLLSSRGYNPPVIGISNLRSPLHSYMSSLHRNIFHFVSALPILWNKHPQHTTIDILRDYILFRLQSNCISFQSTYHSPACGTNGQHPLSYVHSTKFNSISNIPYCCLRTSQNSDQLIFRLFHQNYLTFIFPRSNRFRHRRHPPISQMATTNTKIHNRFTTNHTSVLSLSSHLQSTMR